MIRSVSIRYALRSLSRHPGRTLLSVMGIGVGCSIGLIAIAFYSGASEMQIRAAAESGAGHLRIVPAGWVELEENSMRLADWKSAVQTLKSTPRVKSIVPRARASGLLAFGNRTVGIEMHGVVPLAEHESNRIVNRATLKGRYLEKGDSGSIVIGETVAKKLDVEVDDDLMYTTSGKDEIQSAMLTIVGILKTGNRELDSTIGHVMLDDFESLTGYAGPGEITVMLDGVQYVDEIQALLATQIDSGDEVVTWRKVNPMIAAGVQGDTAFMNFLSFIIVVLVTLGITSAQLTAFLERRAEFGVLTALGMKARQVVVLILIEGLATGFAGAIVALLIGLPISYYLSITGLDMTFFMGEEVSFFGALYDPVMYGGFGFWIVPYAFTVAVASAVVASIYPMWIAIKTNPVEAIRGA